MILEFMGKALDYYEHFLLDTPYIGYISPNGTLIDYNSKNENLHSDFGNLISWTFLLWIIQNDILKTNNKNITAQLNTKTGEIKNANISTYNNQIILQKDLLAFLRKAKKDINFIQSIKNKIILSELSNQQNQNNINNEIEAYFGKYNIKQLLLYLKDICIQYLGYDSIERLNPNTETTQSPTYYNHTDIKNFNYLQKPRIITTSNHNINERFYNYILMDWIIQRLPKYVYNERTGIFEKEENFISLYEDETEQNYAKELKSIKRLVPIEDRPKYFR